MKFVEQCEDCQDYEIHNLSTDAEAARWLYSPRDTLITTVILPIILALGVVNNLSFLYVIFRVPQMRSTFNVYLVNLALADSLYLIPSSLYFILTHARSPVLTTSLQFDATPGCVIFTTVDNTGYFTSVALITLVSMERYLALCHPIKHLNIRSKKRTAKLVVSCWLVGFVFALITSFDNSRPWVNYFIWPSSQDYQSLPDEVTTCEPANAWIRYLTIPLENVPWLIALLSVTFMYSGIILKMSKQRGRRRKTWRIRNRIAKMLIVNGTIFFVCQTPHRVFNMTAWICMLTGAPNPFSPLGFTVRWISYLPQAVNTIINPFVYGAMNTQYRKAFVKAFKCRLGNRRFKARSIYTVNTPNRSTITEQV